MYYHLYTCFYKVFALKSGSTFSVRINCSKNLQKISLHEFLLFKYNNFSRTITIDLLFIFYIVLFLWYHPSFVFSSVVSNEWRYSYKYSNHYQMKNKKRHSFHDYTFFNSSFNFMQLNLSGLALNNTKNISSSFIFLNIIINLYRFSKFFNDFQCNLLPSI